MHWCCLYSTLWKARLDIMSNKHGDPRFVGPLRYFCIIVVAKTKIVTVGSVICQCIYHLPVRFLSSRYEMWALVRRSLNFFARPKSIMYSLLQWRPIPIRKLSGLMSRWMKHLQWMNSTRPSIWSKSNIMLYFFLTST